jgi:putative hydrolase of the HAD superfamily
MIKAIIFDFGNVICTFDNNRFLGRIAKHTDKPVDELYQLIYRGSGLSKQLETGKITGEEFYEKVSELCGLNMPIEEFRKAYTDIFDPIPTTFDLIKRLKGKYTIALLSNTSEWDFKYGFLPFDVIGLMEHITTSYEVGVMKPGKEIYLDSLEKLGLKPDECVYMDDIEAYAQAASDLGMHGIHYTSHEKLIEELRKLGVQ